MTDGGLPVILVAEDDPNDALLLRRAMRRARLPNPVVVASDGDQAIAYLAATGTYEGRSRADPPALLLLDLKMPRRDGFEVLDWVRAQPDIGNLPVVVLTSSRETADIDRAYSLGANSYLVKPGEPVAFVELLRTLDLYWLVLNEPPLGER